MALEFQAERYCDDVIEGRVTAGRWTRLACERHRRDMEQGADRGLHFDEQGAKMTLAFFSVLRHSKGEWAGQPVLLQPWQQFHLWNLFGWRRPDGTRRFRRSYLEVARKNGKSTMGAGVGLFLVVADGEPGAEVYTGATKRDQARIIHQEAVRMVRQSPALARELTLYKDNIHSRKTFSKFEPLGRDSQTLDGLNVHGAVIDELHAHPTGELWDVLDTATGSRRQPLMYAVTTAGHNRQSICAQFHDYTEKVLAGVVEDDAWHGVVYTLDRDPNTGQVEDWENEDSWIKANPNLGVSKKLADMKDKAVQARQMPARLNAFLQKELNIWVAGATRWIDPDRWRACNLRPIDPAALVGRRCYGGLDLSSTLDITAWVLVFPPLPGDTIYDILCRFWIPADNIAERVKRDRVPYDAWLRAGLVTATPGNVVDYAFIRAQLREDASRYKIQEIAFDPWNATDVSNKMSEDGATMVEFRQGFFSMNPAMKSLEVAIQRRTINHGGNPALSWMADNLVARQDPAGNLKADKEQSREKIDGMVALIMGHHRAVLHTGAAGSIYEHRGIRVIG